MTDPLQLANQYFKLSNDGNLTEIQTLLTPSSTYSSVSTGVYLGADQIMQMQNDFYALFETMHWDIHHAEVVKPGIVLFDFTFTGTKLDGETIHREGLEYVIIFDGKIQHIEVRNKA